MESIYYGKALIGAPISGDQAGACFRVELLGVGISLQDSPSVQTIIEAVKKVRRQEGEPEN